MLYPGNSQPTNYPAAPTETDEERIQALLDTAGLQDKQDLLREQLEQAIALRKGSGQRHYGLAGGLANGIADALKNVGSFMQEARLEPKIQENMEQINQGNKSMGKTLLSLFRGMQQRPPVSADTEGMEIGYAPQKISEAKRAGLAGAFTFGGY